ncbi:MAG: hypothetical protein KC620_25200 [Myxococcales bacterium]|nr:hypothetical protein [Myxococcales bacterium]
MALAAERTAPRLTLDDLATESVSALAGRYAGGTVPTDLRTLDGRPTGRMLAVRGADRGPLFGALRRFAGGAAFPWEGKSLHAADARFGAGINRVRLGGRHQLFAFRTSFEPSLLDGAPCIRLDYDLAENPGLIRKIHDEIREVAPGLYLGPAMWKGATGAALVLWFGLDLEAQCAAPTWP